MVLSLLICAGLLVYGSGRGLDLTDEIFYLVWTHDPNAYWLIYQPFGYLLHPLFNLVGGDLQTYRLAGFSIAAAAGVVLGWSLSPAGKAPPVFALYGAAAALTIFFPWIITPSYNSAANVGALLILAGILNAFADRQARRHIGAVAAAVGLCLAAFSKPPLFAIGVAVMLLGAFSSRRQPAALPLVAAPLLGASLICLFLAPAELPGLVRRMAASQDILALPNTPFGLPAKILRDWGEVPLALSGAALAAAMSFVLRRTRWFAWPGYAAVALSLSYAWDAATDVTDGDTPDFIGLALVLLAAGYAGVVQHRDGARLPTIGLLLAAPGAVALGTFNNQWSQFNFSMAFPLLAIFTLASADPASWRRRIAQALCALGPPAVMVLAASNPYSLPVSIFEQQTSIYPPLVHGSLLVDEETARFVNSARGLARGALLIDLSGTGPGVSAVLDARAPVVAWLNPASPAGPDIVWSRLTSEERENAWFVGPMWKAFESSTPAKWLAAHKADYCARTLPPMVFWKEERTLQIWRPCGNGSRIMAKPQAHAVATF
ncbi:hypothetical protein KRR38_12990 [Novosphingobium sp. G106]|uniref:hypothetical protein n=1 Tax=Novosphingobium sp. G106 TaxID=2849500 RepID=UPI001C2D82C0|nr:hypothetical protein [Novosphingobium sp. G106]MBV1688566.1 hypothetical protein [Novosphingobium sp. G106]